MIDNNGLGPRGNVDLNKTIPFRKRRKISVFDLLAVILCPIVSALVWWLYKKQTDGILITSIIAFLFALFMFNGTRNNRKSGGGGVLNTFALILSILSYAFTGCLSIYLVFITYKNESSFFLFNPSQNIGFSLTHLPAWVWLVLVFVIIYVLRVAGPAKARRKIKELADSSIEMSPEEFLDLRSHYRGAFRNLQGLDCPGVYILYNQTKKMYYVGQGQNVLSRVRQHFTGNGNGDVYADWKYGNQFTIRIIRLEGSGFQTLNALERNTIAAYNAYSRGYNKTRGNRG